VSRVRIGRLGKPHALAGGLKYRSEAPEALLGRSRVYLEGLGWRAIERLEEISGELIVYFVGVDDRHAAEQLAGRDVYVEIESLPEVEDGWYYFQLVGMPVYLNGQPAGRVAEVFDAGAQDVLVVERGPQRYMIPLQAPYVKVADGEIHLDKPPEGLLE